MTRSKTDWILWGGLLLVGLALLSEVKVDLSIGAEAQWTVPTHTPARTTAPRPSPTPRPSGPTPTPVSRTPIPTPTPSGAPSTAIYTRWRVTVEWQDPMTGQWTVDSVHLHEGAGPIEVKATLQRYQR